MNSLKDSGIVLVNSDNYNLWQYEQFRKYIGKRTLEIGCGLGNITQHILHDTDFLLSVDIKRDALKFIKNRIPQSNNFRIERINVFSESLGKYSRIQFDTIVLSNVLEHLNDDLLAFKKCHSILKRTKGKLLLLVPAHNYLYGTLDREAGHVRRYEKKDIILLSQKAKFQILDIYEFNFLGAIGWYINYCLLKLKDTNNSTSTTEVSLYDKWLVKPSRFIESRIRTPIGLSIIAIMEVK